MQKGPANYETVLLALGCLVIIVWAIAVLVQVVNPAHPVPNAVNIVTPIVATGLFGTAYLTGRKKNGDGDDK